MKVSRPKGNPLLLRRSLKHLYPLEVSAIDKANDNEETQNRDIRDRNEPTENVISAKDTVAERQRRSAAVAGELRRRLNVLN